MNTISLPHFSFDELKCRATGEVRLAYGFGEALEALRVAYGRPMLITSACRSKAHNETIGGHPRSLHVHDDPHWKTGGCVAVDVAMTDAVRRGQLIAVAYSMGWSVGVASNFLHLDKRIDYTALPQVIYHYRR